MRYTIEIIKSNNELREKNIERLGKIEKENII
jgi:hypothetical protein